MSKLLIHELETGAELISASWNDTKITQLSEMIHLL